MLSAIKSKKGRNYLARGIASMILASILMLALACGGLTVPAQAEMVAKSLSFYMDRDASGKQIQLDGSANYPTFKYVITRSPMNGTLTLDSASGIATYVQPGFCRN